MEGLDLLWNYSGGRPRRLQSVQELLGSSRVEGPVDYRVSRKYSGISRVKGPVDYRVSRNYSGISRVEGLDLLWNYSGGRPRILQSVQELLGN